MRHTFDRFEIDDDLIDKERVRTGNLRSYDVIVVPNQGRGGARDRVFDVCPANRPIAYRKSDRYKSLGTYRESEDITGGVGLEAAAELRKFTERGGVLIENLYCCNQGEGFRATSS